MGLVDRGYVREGFKADITIFDYEQIEDRATILAPDVYPEGMEYVMVNGVLTLDGGVLTGTLPGTVLDRREKER